jgi:hypothetical protein
MLALCPGLFSVMPSQGPLNHRHLIYINAREIKFGNDISVCIVERVFLNVIAAHCVTEIHLPNTNIM